MGLICAGQIDFSHRKPLLSYAPLSRQHPVEGGLPTNKYRQEDKQNYPLLLKEIRRQLDAVGHKKYLLTIT